MTINFNLTSLSQSGLQQQDYGNWQLTTDNWQLTTNQIRFTWGVLDG